MMKEHVFIFSRVSEIILLSATLASVCVKGCVIYLYGDIGSGKSVFCRGFLNKLGYVGRVNSPTYTLIESYSINNWNIHHCDFYRLNSVEEFESIGLRDFFDGNAVCLVEWPKKNMKVLPAEDISITINYYDMSINSRQVIVKFVSDLGLNMLKAVLPYWNTFK